MKKRTKNESSEISNYHEAKKAANQYPMISDPFGWPMMKNHKGWENLDSGGYFMGAGGNTYLARRLKPDERRIESLKLHAEASRSKRKKAEIKKIIKFLRANLPKKLPPRERRVD